MIFCEGCYSCMQPCGREEGRKRVFVIGNGIGRKDFDLNQLVNKGKIIVCNEAYREFSSFDAIASIDGSSTIDIRKNVDLEKVIHIHKWHSNWFVGTKDMGKLEGSHNSGQLALRGAIELYNPSVVYMLGIDLGGRRLYTDKVSGPPTRKCNDTWNELYSKTSVINVPKDLTYKELNEDILSR